MIDTVLFDMGGTIEDIYSDDASIARALRAVADTLRERAGVTLDPEAMREPLMAGRAAYKRFAEETGYEPRPIEIWRDYYLRELVAPERLDGDTCERLAHLWETTFNVRALRPGVHEMLDGLKSLGLRLGIISNTTSQFQVFHTLEEHDLRRYFDSVVLSSLTGYRKPHPVIFRAALWQMGKQDEPGAVAYVGDTISRDVIGPQKAGFGETFFIRSFLTASRDVNIGDAKPDHVIEDIREVYTILKAELGR